MNNRLIPFMPQIAGGLLAVVAAMAVAIWLLLSANGSCRQTVGEQANAIRGFQASHQTQEQSISDLSIALEVKNAESDARAAQYEAQKLADAKRVAEADLRATTTLQRIERLNRIAATGASVCGVSDELRGALEGL